MIKPGRVVGYANLERKNISLNLNCSVDHKEKLQYFSRLNLCDNSRLFWYHIKNIYILLFLSIGIVTSQHAAQFVPKLEI